MQQTSRTVRTKLIYLPLFASSLAIGGCAYNPSSPDIYPASQAQREATVSIATIESVRPVKISSNDGQPSGLGALGGSALGAVAGSTLDNGNGALLTSIIGGIVGAIAGNAIENGVAMRDGLEITVRFDNGDLRAITQDTTGDVFAAGDRVRILWANGITRVTHFAASGIGT
jgi:outer membrane lipoprotein SlyB